jgi:hypothetical protein
MQGEEADGAALAAAASGQQHQQQQQQQQRRAGEEVSASADYGLSYIEAMKQTARVSWTGALPAVPSWLWGGGHRAGGSGGGVSSGGAATWRNSPLCQPTELLASKSLDTETDGSPW